MVTGHVVSTPFQLSLKSLFHRVLCTCFRLQVSQFCATLQRKVPLYCQHLWPGLLLPTLLDTLALSSDTEVVGQSVELLQAAVPLSARWLLALVPCPPVPPWPPSLQSLVISLGLASLGGLQVLKTSVLCWEYTLPRRGGPTQGCGACVLPLRDPVLNLFLPCSQAAQAFLQQSGLQALQRHEEVAQLQIACMLSSRQLFMGDSDF